jgi:hypothetical protein
MGDVCKTKKIEVSVQENGIIRDSEGRIIARLVEDITFHDISLVTDPPPGAEIR